MKPELEFLAKPINSQDDAENFILCLEDVGLLFDFDDNPSKTFSEEELPHVKQRVIELFMYLDNPNATALELTMATDETRSFGPRK